MKIRLTVAFVLQIIAGLFSFLTWIDPLEGGAAVAMVAILTVVVRFVGKVRIPALTWISIASALVVAGITIAIAVSRIDVNQQTGEAHATNLSQDLVVWISIYRVTAVAVIAGAAFYAIKIFETIRRSKNA